MTERRNAANNSTKSFQGLRVLDFSTTIAGPHCTRMLADMGAEVIKIEPAEGETMRSRPPLRNNFSSRFRPAQCRQEEPRARSEIADRRSKSIRRLVASADILVENFRPGVMRRLKLDYASLQQLNPRLIYCSISGYGQTGPSAELPAYAPVIHAASGYDMAHLSYQPGRIAAGLLRHLSRRCDHRRLCLRRHFGGAVPASASSKRSAHRRLDAGIDAQPDAERSAVRRSSTVTSPSRPMFGPVETADGYVMVAIASEKTFQSLVTAAGHPEWIGDPRFAKYADRRDHWKDLMEGVESVVAHVDHRTMPRRAQCRAAFPVRPIAPLPSDGRSSDRASRRAGRGGRRWRHLQGHEFAVPDVAGPGRCGKARGNAGRTHGRVSQGERPFRR